MATTKTFLHSPKNPEIGDILTDCTILGILETFKDVELSEPEVINFTMEELVKHNSNSPIRGYIFTSLHRLHLKGFVEMYLKSPSSSLYCRLNYN